VDFNASHLSHFISYTSFWLLKRNLLWYPIYDTWFRFGPIVFSHINYRTSLFHESCIILTITPFCYSWSPFIISHFKRKNRQSISINHVLWFNEIKWIYIDCYAIEVLVEVVYDGEKKNVIMN
jgi:hypothetical protein